MGEYDLKEQCAMTERETVDTFARQVAQVMRRLEAERQNRKLEEGKECVTLPTCG